MMTKYKKLKSWNEDNSLHITDTKNPSGNSADGNENENGESGCFRWMVLLFHVIRTFAQQRMAFRSSMVEPVFGLN
jgi:hypothetical protein